MIGNLVDFLQLHLLQDGTRLSSSFVPPAHLGMTWSIVAMCSGGQPSLNTVDGVSSIGATSTTSVNFLNPTGSCRDLVKSQISLPQYEHFQPRLSKNSMRFRLNVLYPFKGHLRFTSLRYTRTWGTSNLNSRWSRCKISQVPHNTSRTFVSRVGRDHR